MEQLGVEMKDSHQDKRGHTRNDTHTGYAERRDTRQSAARPGTECRKTTPAGKTESVQHTNLGRGRYH